MKHKLLQLNTLVLLTIVSCAVIAIMLPPSTTNQPYVFQKPLDIIHLFYEAVDRDELTVFGIEVKKDNLIPTHVEYVYDLSNSVPLIKVHCSLKKPIPLPEGGGAVISAVTALIENGHIIESIAHISFDEVEKK